MRKLSTHTFGHHDLEMSPLHKHQGPAPSLCCVLQLVWNCWKLLPWWLALCTESAEHVHPAEMWDARSAQEIPQGSSCALWEPQKNKMSFTEQ